MADIEELELTPRMLAKHLYKDDFISYKQYKTILSRGGAERTNHNSYAMQYLREVLKQNGIDGIVYMNERFDKGSLAVIVLDPSQLIPVTRNGVAVDNNIEALADSEIGAAFLMLENDAEDSENLAERSGENGFDSEKDSEYNEIEKTKCRNEHLDGENHAVTNVSFVKKQIAINGKTVEAVVPKFDSVFDAKLPEELYTVSDRKQFKDCYSQLRKELKINNELRKCFTVEEIKIIENGATLDNYIWHHDVEKGKMQLVNRKIHGKTGHTGGRFFWGGGTKNR